jgi:hypothetical protein
VTSLRFFVPLEEPITRSVGDVLRLGFDVWQMYGKPMTVSLHARRLVCLNGMTADRQVFSWRSRDQRDQDSQREWLEEALSRTRDSFSRMVAGARRMAATPLTADPHTLLLSAARAMHLPRRYENDLVEAFAAEPGDTYWHLQNAITRLASHQGLPANLQASVWESAGSWTRDFRMCRAELPLPTALSVGARILPDDNSQN